jgi:hypothetical protein
MAESDPRRFESSAEHESAQHRRFAALSLAEKLAWLEQAQAFAAEALRAHERRRRED